MRGPGGSSFSESGAGRPLDGIVRATQRIHGCIFVRRSPPCFEGSGNPRPAPTSRRIAPAVPIRLSYPFTYTKTDTGIVYVNVSAIGTQIEIAVEIGSPLPSPTGLSLAHEVDPPSRLREMVGVRAPLERKGIWLPGEKGIWGKGIWLPAIPATCGAILISIWISIGYVDG